MKRIKIYFLKITSLILLMLLSITIFACKKYAKLPRADIIVLEDKTEVFYDKVNLYFKIDFLNSYKQKQDDKIYVSYIDIHNTENQMIPCKKIDDHYTITFYDLPHKRDINVVFHYEYEKDKSRIIKDNFIISASGSDYDPKDEVLINNYDDYYRLAKENLISEHLDKSVKIRKKYSLKNDIDFLNKPFIPFAKNFAGVFNGNGNKLLNINSTSSTSELPINEKDSITITNTGLVNTLLEGASITNLTINNMSYTNNTEIDLINETPFKNSPFGIIAGKANTTSTIENITINNVNIDLVVFPSCYSLEEANNNANYGLLVGTNMGTVSDIKINKAHFNITNYGAVGANVGLLSGSIASTSLTSKIDIRLSKVNYSSSIDPFRLEHKEFQINQDFIKIDDYFNEIENNAYYKSNVGIIAGKSNANTEALYLTGNSVKYKEVENVEFVTCFLMGRAIGFDYKDIYYNDKVIDNVLVSKTSKNFRKGDTVRLYLNLNELDLNENSLPIFKKLYVNNIDHTSEVQYLPGANGIYYFDFTITKDSFCFVDTNYNKDNNLITINNPIDNIENYTNITPGVKPNAPHISINYLGELTFKVNETKFNENKDNYKYALIDYSNASMTTSGEITDKVFSYISKVDAQGRIQFPALTNSFNINFIKKPKEEIRLGQVYGSGSKFKYAFLESNSVDYTGNGDYLNNQDRNISFNNISLGLYTGDFQMLNIFNTVMNDFRIDGNPLFLNPKYTEQKYGNNTNYFLTKPKIFGIEENVEIFEEGYSYFQNEGNLTDFFTKSYKDFFIESFK